MASSKRLAGLICSLASLVYFVIIIFQVPIFGVPCRTEICRTPIEVTSSQLLASELFPPFIVKLLLYPGALAKALYKNKPIPSFRNLLKLYNFNMKLASPKSDLQRLEVLAGSYLSVAGAIVSLIRSGRMSLFGILLLTWGLIRESIMKKSGFSNANVIHIYPAMWVALVSAFFSVKKDVRKIIRSFRGKRSSKTKSS